MADRVDPYKNFRFRVELQGIQIAAFSHATVPDETMDAIEYREGIDPHIRKLSGMHKVGTLSLKRGVNPSLELYDWWRRVQMLGASAPLSRKNISLVLVDDAGEDAARWDLHMAWPTKYQVAELDAKSNDVLIETLEIALESMKRAK